MTKKPNGHSPPEPGAPRPAAPPDHLEVAAETLLGDLIGGALEELRVLPQVWAKLPEVEQAIVIDRLTRKFQTAVKQAIPIIASRNTEHLDATVESVTCKNGLKAVLKMSSQNPARHALIDHVGEQVLLVVGLVSETRAFGTVSKTRDSVVVPQARFQHDVSKTRDSVVVPQARFQHVVSKTRDSVVDGEQFAGGLDAVQAEPDQADLPPPNVPLEGRPALPAPPAAASSGTDAGAAP
jgi:hypothetical protein